MPGYPILKMHDTNRVVWTIPNQHAFPFRPMPILAESQDTVEAARAAVFHPTVGLSDRVDCGFFAVNCGQSVTQPQADCCDAQKQAFQAEA